MLDLLVLAFLGVGSVGFLVIVLHRAQRSAHGKGTLNSRLTKRLQDSEHENSAALGPTSPFPQRWFQSSPWTAMAREQGWRCTPEFYKRAVAALGVKSPSDTQNFHMTVRLNDSESMSETVVIRREMARPSGGLKLATGTLSWRFDTARLSPRGPWIPSGGRKQELRWEAPNLELHLRAPKRDKQTILDALSLFESLHQAQYSYWYDPPPGWTLKLDSTGQWPRLSRLVNGVLVNANLEWVQGALRTRIMAPLPPQSARFTLVHPDFREGPKVSTRHPIADSLLHAEGDGEALHGLLQDADAFSAIMAIVHGHPGSRLTQDRIELIAAGDMGDGLLQAMNKVVRAASAISASAE